MYLYTCATLAKITDLINKLLQLLFLTVLSDYMGRGILLTANLPQLQNLIKRDPNGYKEEFLQQWNHYNSIREIFQINPDEQAQHFRELVSFISQVSPTSCLSQLRCTIYVCRLPSVIQKRRQSFPRSFRRCYLKIMGHSRQMLARHSSRTWLCCETRT